MWRVVTEDLIEFDDLWWKYSLIGPNRDQISFDTARQLTSMKMNILEYGWFAKKGFRQPGSMGMLFGSTGKVGRRKLHPQAGHDRQYLERDKLLLELRKLTGLHPHIYARHNHMPFVYMNVINPRYPS